MPPATSSPASKAGMVSQTLGYGDDPSQELADELERRRKKLSQASQFGSGPVSQFMMAQPPSMGTGT